MTYDAPRLAPKNIIESNQVRGVERAGSERARGRHDFVSGGSAVLCPRSGLPSSRRSAGDPRIEQEEIFHITGKFTYRPPSIHISWALVTLGAHLVATSAVQGARGDAGVEVERTAVRASARKHPTTGPARPEIPFADGALAKPCTHGGHRAASGSPEVRPPPRSRGRGQSLDRRPDRRGGRWIATVVCVKPANEVLKRPRQQGVWAVQPKRRESAKLHGCCCECSAGQGAPHHSERTAPQATRGPRRRQQARCP